MKIQTLITLGIIIYIYFSLKKAMSFGKKDGGTAKSPGWKDKLQEMADQIKEEIEKANQQAQPTPPPPPLPRSESDFQWSEEDNDLETITDETAYDDQPPLIIKQRPVPEAENNAPSVRLDEDGQMDQKRPSPELPCGMESVAKPSSSYRHVSRHTLKNAVIWSEILSKPLSLRD